MPTAATSPRARAGHGRAPSGRGKARLGAARVRRIIGMALRPVQVNIKALDDAAVGGFWAEALGWGVSSEGPGVTNVEPADDFVWPDPVAVCIDVVAVPEPKTSTKNRVHLDLATTSAAHQAELVARLRTLGATPADVGQGDVPWTVLADPEGNEFCVEASKAEYGKFNAEGAQPDGEENEG